MNHYKKYIANWNFNIEYLSMCFLISYHEIEDYTSNALLKSLNKQFPTYNHFFKFIKTCVKNLIIDNRRSPKYGLVKYQPNVKENMEFEFDNNNLSIFVLNKKLKQLPSEHRKLVLLRKYNFSYNEIAEILGENRNALLSRFHRIKQKILAS